MFNENAILTTGTTESNLAIKDVRGIKFAFSGFNDIDVNQPDERQKELGHLTIDSGADLVIGNHPHWIKPIEIYHNKLITYAHGNFVFDQGWSQKTKEGVVGKYTFYDKALVDVEYFPVEIIDYGQPYFLDGVKKKKILDEMYSESMKLSSTLH